MFISTLTRKETFNMFDLKKPIMLFVIMISLSFAIEQVKLVQGESLTGKARATQAVANEDSSSLNREVMATHLTGMRSLNVAGKTPYNFDGDTKSDFVLWRASAAEWRILNSSNGTSRIDQFGLSTDKPVPGDYDGDGKTDLAVFRSSDATWYMVKSSNGAFMGVQFGASTDIPVQGYYDTDNKTDIAVWRPGTGTWYILNSKTSSITSAPFGLAGDQPVPGEYDGDGKYDPAVFRPSNNTWYILKSTNGGLLANAFGSLGDKLVPEDYDGDSITDIAVFRPSNGFWYVLKSSNGAFIYTSWGLSADVPAPADYDGDGQADYAVWRPSDGTWYVIRSTNGTYAAQPWGSPSAGDAPVSTVYPTAGTVAGIITRASDNVPLSSALVEVLQSGVVKASATTGANGIYTPFILLAGTYDVRVTAAGFASEMNSGISVMAGTTSTVNFSLQVPGTITGRVMKTDGITSVGAAIVRVYQGTVLKSTNTTNGNGDYTASGLSPGSYVVEASATGYETVSWHGISVVANSSTSLDIALGTSSIKYLYDDVGRLARIINQAGDIAIYSYDAVGNLLSIQRPTTSNLALVSFSPHEGTAGDLVTFYGVGFNTTTASVSFNGAPSPRFQVTPSLIVAEVPQDATTGTVTITTPQGNLTTPTPFTVVARVQVSPAFVGLLPGDRFQFNAVTVPLSGDQRVLWSVNGIAGGNSTVGTITSAGLYTAPAQSPPSSPSISIKAASVLDPIRLGRAEATVINQNSIRIPLSSAVSIRFGVAAGVGAARGAAVSVMKGPYITATSPVQIARGATITLTVTGVNLSGATALKFITSSGVIDGDLSVSGISVNPGGTSLTATVVVNSSAAIGQRTVIILTPNGTSITAVVSSSTIEITS